MAENIQRLAERGQRGMVARGSAMWLTARLLYVITGFGIHVIVSRVLGPEVYAKFGAVMALAAVFYLGVRVAIPPAVSRYIAARSTQQRDIFRTGLQLQSLLCAGLALAFWIAGDQIADWLLRDPNLGLHVQIAGLAILPMGLHFLYVNGLLGRRDYPMASFLSSLASLLRLAGVGIVVVLGGGVIGVFEAYLVAPCLVVAFAVWKIKFQKPTTKMLYWGEIARFSVPMLVVGLLSSLMLQMSTLFVNGFVGPREMVGMYIAASVLANAPYHIFEGLSAVLMPAVSNAEAVNDATLLERHVHESIRVLTLLSVPFLVWLFFNAGVTVELVYGNRYLGAADTVVILTMGTTLLAYGQVLLSVTHGIGKPWVSAVFLMGNGLLTAAANMMLIPRLGVLGGAWAVVLGGAGLVLTSGIYVYARCGVLFPGRSFGRIVLAGGIAFLTASLVEVQGLYGLIAQTAAVGTVYLGVLWKMGELANLDVRSWRRLTAAQNLS